MSGRIRYTDEFKRAAVASNFSVLILLPNSRTLTNIKLSLKMSKECPQNHELQPANALLLRGFVFGFGRVTRAIFQMAIKR